MAPKPNSGKQKGVTLEKILSSISSFPAAWLMAEGLNLEEHKSITEMAEKIPVQYKKIFTQQRIYQCLEFASVTGIVKKNRTPGIAPNKPSHYVLSNREYKIAGQIALFFAAANDFDLGSVFNGPKNLDSMNAGLVGKGNLSHLLASGETKFMDLIETHGYHGSTIYKILSNMKKKGLATFEFSPGNRPATYTLSGDLRNWFMGQLDTLSISIYTYLENNETNSFNFNNISCNVSPIVFSQRMNKLLELGLVKKQDSPVTGNEEYIEEYNIVRPEHNQSDYTQVANNGGCNTGNYHSHNNLVEKPKKRDWNLYALLLGQLSLTKPLIPIIYRQYLIGNLAENKPFDVFSLKDAIENDLSSISILASSRFSGRPSKVESDQMGNIQISESTSNRIVFLMKSTETEGALMRYKGEVGKRSSKKYTIRLTSAATKYYHEILGCAKTLAGGEWHAFNDAENTSYKGIFSNPNDWNLLMSDSGFSNRVYETIKKYIRNSPNNGEKVQNGHIMNGKGTKNYSLIPESVCQKFVDAMNQYIGETNSASCTDNGLYNPNGIRDIDIASTLEISVAMSNLIAAKLEIEGKIKITLADLLNYYKLAPCK